jgi:hypothetical protein
MLTCVVARYSAEAFILGDYVPRKVFVCQLRNCWACPSIWDSSRPVAHVIIFLLQEYGPCGWAACEDITPEFLELLAAGPL